MICPHCKAQHARDAKACPQTGRAMPDTIPDGTVLEGKYQILRFLASGGMGSVYVGEHTLIGKKVAIKVLHPEFAKNDDIVARFKREARAASAIGHDNIVDIQDLGRTPEGGLFLVMELLTGTDLSDVLLNAPESKINPVRAVGLMLQVLSALDAAHKHGIVHRDLKPENVYITQKRRQEFVKVIDFGISKILTDEQSLNLTSTGFVLGTPYYMAPEQARGGKLDHRVDIYAAGTILYQSVCGRLPFNAPNFNALLFEIASGKIAPPRSLTPSLDPEIEAVILRAMALDQDQRYPSAEQFAGDLERWLARVAPAVVAADQSGAYLTPPQGYLQPPTPSPYAPYPVYPGHPLTPPGMLPQGAVLAPPGAHPVPYPPGAAGSQPGVWGGVKYPSPTPFPMSGPAATPRPATPGMPRQTAVAAGTTRHRLAAVVGGGVILGLLVTAIVIAVSHKKPTGPARTSIEALRVEPSAPPVVRPTAAAPATNARLTPAPAVPAPVVPVPKPVAAAAPVAAPAAKTVTVTFNVSPPDAVLILDGKVVKGPQAFPAGDRTAHELKAEKAGYASKSVRFVPAELAASPSPQVGLTLHHHHPAGPGGSIDL